MAEDALVLVIPRRIVEALEALPAGDERRDLARQRLFELVSFGEVEGQGSLTVLAGMADLCDWPASMAAV